MEMNEISHQTEAVGALGQNIGPSYNLLLKIFDRAYLMYVVLILDVLFD